MAKTTSWTGNLSGDWGVAGNWSNGVPVATDTVIIPRTATRDITAGLAQGAVDLAKLHIAEHCKIDIGQPGAPLSIGADLLIHAGKGTIYWTTANAGVHVDQMVIDSDNRVLAADLYKGAGNGLVPRLLVVKGKVSCGDIIKTGRIELDYRHSSHSDAIIECKPDFTSEVQLLINGGRFSGSPSLLTAVLQSGGVVRVAGTTGVVVWNIHMGQAYFNSSGNITTLHAMGGVMDFSENDNEITITHLYKYADGEIILTDLVTVTNEYIMTGVGKAA